MIVERETFEISKGNCMSENQSKTFSHKDKKERGEQISLPDTAGGIEGSRRGTIDEDKEKGSGYETKNPTCLGVIETESK